MVQAKTATHSFHAFADCISAIDGTHVQLIVPVEEAGQWRSRKSSTSTNVFVSVNQSMLFTACIPGAEGPAPDCDVWRKLKASGFTVPDGKWLIADAGYGLERTVLTPFRGIRYHLRERNDPLAQRGKKPKNRFELFNLRHALFRNVVERTIGVWKARWRVLHTQFRCKKEVAFDAIVVCAILHNYLRITRHELLQKERAQEFEDAHDNTDDAVFDGTVRGLRTCANRWRDSMSRTMWNEYRLRRQACVFKEGAENRSMRSRA